MLCEVLHFLEGMPLTCESSSKGPDTLFQPPQVHNTHVHAHIDMYVGRTLIQKAGLPVRK